jgi:hypothetical protein
MEQQAPLVFKDSMEQLVPELQVQVVPQVQVAYKDLMVPQVYKAT